MKLPTLIALFLGLIFGAGLMAFFLPPPHAKPSHRIIIAWPPEAR